jgi:predicted phosphoadenosine phosphosulfate sulfurtransferase
MDKIGLGVNVLDAARERISTVFDEFKKIYVSFSGGKDSGVMLHLVMDEAIKRDRKVGVLFVDLEGQYKLTIDYIQKMYDKYTENIDPFWVSLPLNLRNAVSVYEPQWTAWDPTRKKDWIRNPPNNAIVDESYFPFYKYGMEFEEFVPAFGHWYADGDLTACFVGIRSDESLNRWRTVATMRKTCFEDYKWTTWIGESTFNIYPIYDWKTQDIWTYNGKFQADYNRLYDRMHQAGLTIHQARICQPYGDDQRRGLWLFHVIEPETWARIVARVNGANSGALYCQESGNVQGRIKITKPEGHTWESFARLLLGSMPKQTREHYEDKFCVFVKWYKDRGFEMSDDGSINKGNEAENANWKRICKVLLRNDYWCKGLSFTQHKSEAYEKYKRLMKRRREAPEWNLI